MNAARIADRIVDALASLRLAVTLMVTLALTCLTATVYESKHGTAAAQREFYQTGWFTTILALLGINIFWSMMKRYPWKAHHAGFVLAHVGILTLLAGSLISLHFGLDSNMALYEGETSDRVAALEKALHVALPDGGAASFSYDFERRPVGGGRERRFPIPGSGLTLVAEDFLPHTRSVEEWRAAADGPAALHFLLQAPFATQDAWLVADDPERSHLELGPLTAGFHRAPSETAAAELLHHRAEGNQLSFVLLPDGSLRYGLTSRGVAGDSGRVEPGAALETPWMGMKVVVERLLPHADVSRSVAPAPPPVKDERRQPAVKVRLEGPAGRTPSEWVPWTETRAIPLAGGLARVAYRAPELALPFRVTLTRFNSDKYPGSSMAATYESWVRVEDPERGVSEHHISMNHPLHYRGYVFFQASFVEGRPMMSIFSVARAPGLPLVYVGVVLISSGVAWMFYLKPYLAKRRAARALAAHREREERDAEQAGAGAVGPRASEPASSGA